MSFICLKSQFAMEHQQLLLSSFRLGVGKCTGSFPRFTTMPIHVQSHSSCSDLEPPDVVRLTETARIALTPQEVEEFAPKIKQVIDWFGQLQSVDLRSVEPSIRAADTESGSVRDDIPQIFENRESMIAAIPNYEEPYIGVPSVLNKEG